MISPATPFTLTRAQIGLVCLGALVATAGLTVVGGVTVAIGGLLAVSLIVVVSSRVEASATALILGVLFNLAGLSFLHRLGLSPAVIKGLSFWKLGIVAGLGLAVLRQGRWRRLDLLDRAALAYVALGLAYLVAPRLFVGNALGGHLTLYERALGWRGDVFYVLAFVIFRHLRLSSRFVDRLLDRFLLVAVAFAVIGLFEAAAPSAFNHLAVSGLGIPSYEHDIIGYQPSPAFRLDTVLVYSGSVLRDGSLLVDYLSVGFVYAIGLGVAVERIARRQGGRWMWAAVGCLLAATALTESRSAIIAATVTVLFVLRRRAGKSLASRARLARVFAVGLVVAVPLVLATGTLVRFVNAHDSNAVHRTALRGGLDSLTYAPLGNGLGAAEGGAQILLASANVSVVTEDQYLQIGAVMGFPGLILYLIVVAAILRRLWRRARDDPDATASSAMSSIAIGAFVGCLFTQAFTNLELSLVFWALAGASVGVVDRRSDAQGVEGRPLAMHADR